MQLNKLPELANSVKRRMSSHVKPKTSLTTDSPPVMASPHGLNNDDDDDDDVIIGDSDIAAEVKVAVMRRPTIAMPDSCGGGGRQPGSRNHTGAVYVLSRKRKQFQIKWSILGNGSLRWFNEQTSLAIPKETIQLSHVFREPTTRQQQRPDNNNNNNGLTVGVKLVICAAELSLPGGGLFWARADLS